MNTAATHHHLQLHPSGAAGDATASFDRSSDREQSPGHGRTSRVSLLSVEPEMLESIPERDRPLARRTLTALRCDLPVGGWALSDLPGVETAHGVLILSGAICRETSLGGRVSAHLFGPGSIILARDGAAISLPWRTQWSSVVDSVVAVLDHRFPSLTQRWPELIEVVQRRLTVQLESAICQAAIAEFSRADDRIIALFWQLADVWGTVRPEGIWITLPLTHRLIGRLVGAERATVSLALSRLSESDLLVRSSKRTWVLSPQSQQALL
jgi:hypothetical protein